MGVCYERGQGVEKNYTEAVKWYRKAAEQGHAEAQYKLGFCYKYGDGVEENLTEAAKWYTKAAEQGKATAQFYLAEMYEKGEGVDKDIAEAVKWYNEAKKSEVYAEDAQKALERLGATTTTSENEGENNKKYDGEIYSVVEQMPQFPGGAAAMMRWIKENVKYPAESRENGSQGRAYVSFVVEPDGSISNVEIIRGTGDKLLDNEAIRLVKSMPKWAPGKQLGKSVRTKSTVPIMFKLM